MFFYSCLKRYAFFLLLIIISNVISAQQVGTLRGVMRDSTNGEALAYGNVLIKELNRGASTNDRGYFVLTSIPANKTYTFIFSYVGYQSKEIELYIARKRILDVDIDLIPSSYELQAVEKVAAKYGDINATDISVKTINIKELEALPKGVETDIIRSLQLLPGVQSAGDISAKFYVRGSSSDQNLVLMNGATVYYPFHALGMFSVIDPDMINNVEFYKGGFTSEFSGRLSSVLRLITKDGNSKSYSAKVGASLVTAKALVEGPIPNGSFIITGRKSYSDEVLKKFIDKDIPIDFYDLSFKVNYSNDDFMQNAKFTVHGFLSGDKVENNNPKIEDFNWSNTIIGVNYFQFAEESPLFAELNFVFSEAKGEVIPNLSGSRKRENKITDASASADIHYIYNSKDELIAGLKVQEVNTVLKISKSLDDYSDIGDQGTSFSAYVRYRFLRHPQLGIDLGLRANLTRLAGGGSDNKFLEPRINATYAIQEDFSVKAAWGLYLQDLVTVTDENEVISLFDPWTIIPAYLEPSYAQHYVAGFEYLPIPTVKIEIESYYKELSNVPAINEQRYFPMQRMLVDGSGKSYGLEVMADYKEYPINLTANYSYGVAKKTVDGKEFYPRYDIRHKLNLIGQYEFGKGWSASIVWTYSSGFPYTQTAGFYDKLRIDDLFNAGSLFDSFYPFTILGARNAVRMPDYHRLDVSLSKRFTLSGTNLILDVSVVNVYDRANIFYFKRESGERVNMLPFLPTATVKVEL